MKVLYTKEEFQEFVNEWYYNHEYNNMRFGQALMFHFPKLEDSDFGEFNMFYTESTTRCQHEAELYIGEKE